MSDAMEAVEEAPLSVYVEADTAAESPMHVEVNAATAAETENETRDVPISVAFEDASKSTLRTGRWFPEEERYAARLVTEFKNGTLPIPEKITLREFLSLIFHCPPMRITKKFEGNNMIGKITYRRRARLTPLAWWELKELERIFWARMVKSSQPSALEVHAKMVEYSSQVFQDAPDLSQFHTPVKQQQHSANISVNQINSMFVQLQQMLQPVLGTETEDRYRDNESAKANVETLEKMLARSHQNLVDLIAMLELQELPPDRKSLVETARFMVELDIEEMQTMLDEAQGYVSKEENKQSKNFSQSKANMLTLQQMLHDSKLKLFRMEYKLSKLLDHMSADSDSIKILSNSVNKAKKDTEVLEYQLMSMKAEFNEKYNQSEPAI